MTLFVYEHFTSGALAGGFCPPELTAEGDAMLSAIVQDLLALNHDLVIMRDQRLPELTISHTDASLQTIWIKDKESFETCWTRCLQQYDQFLVIAPETDHILLNIARQVQQAQKQWLGCDQPAITVCGDKLQCWHLLEQHNIQTPVTQSAEAWLLNPVTTSLQWVIKPVDGAGCEDTYLLGTRQTREQLAAFSLAERQQFIVQPYISGQTLSLSLFISDNDIDLLSINAQIMTQHQQQLKLTHCQVNLDHLLSPAVAIALAGRIHDTMPGLWGFVGIDLIKTADQLWVIDINPRLTSSYAEAEMRQYHNPALALHAYLTQQ